MNIGFLLKQHLQILNQLPVVVRMIPVYFLPDFWDCKQIGNQPHNLHQSLDIGLFLHGGQIPRGHTDPHFIDLTFTV